MRDYSSCTLGTTVVKLQFSFLTGLAETISFNISSIVPPSPITAALFQDKSVEETQPKHGSGNRRSKRSRSEESSTQILINLDE